MNSIGKAEARRGGMEKGKSINKSIESPQDQNCGADRKIF